MLDKTGVIQRIRLIVSLLGVVLGVVIAFTPPPEGLTVGSMRGIGICAWAISWWITSIIPEYCTGLLMCGLWVAVGSVPFTRAFSGYTSPVWWLVIAAFLLGAVGGKVGLLKRIALWVLKIFPPTFNGQVWGLICSGFIITPLVPSVNGRAALSAPLALAISDTLGVERTSKGSSGLLAACAACLMQTTGLVLSGSGSNYLILGVIGGALAGAGDVSWFGWLGRALVFAVISLVGMGLFICIFLRPEKDVRLPANYVAEQLKELGPMGRQEKTTLIIMVATLVAWMTEPWHSIGSGEVGVISICLLMLFNVATRKDVNGLDWAAILFIGVLLNMVAVIPELKLDTFLGAAMGPIFAPLVMNPFTLVISLVAFAVILKFGIISFTTCTVIILFTVMPVCIKAGIDPFVPAFIVYNAVQVFYRPYTSSAYLCLHYGSHEGMAIHGNMTKFSFAYSILCILGGLASIPYWKYLGLMP